MEKSVRSSMVKTIAIILLALLLVGALLLSVYFYNEYKAAKADVEGQVADAIVAREKAITDALQEKFAEQEKRPYVKITGPEDYGYLSIDYPKTWSAYVAKDASKGGDYEAYLNPSPVNPVAENPHALRITIKSESFENANNRYKSLVTAGKLTSSVINLASTTANRYEGDLPNNYKGIVVLFKIRDKTVTLQTDSSDVYGKDFEQILSSVTFNE